MFDLKGKVALVTGASRGLGWAMAQSLAQAGAHVMLNARDEAVLAGRVAELAGRGLSAEAVAFDVTDEAVANAGIQHRSPITEFATEDFRRVLDTNLTAVWTLSREAARAMLPAGRGRIVLTGSMSAINARATVSAYVASKGAVHALARQLAVELAPSGVTVNCIAPGFFATEMNTALVENEAFSGWVEQRTPVRRWGRVEEIGPAAVFLASDEASFVTGHVLVVDGGFTAAM
jgi:gluconate 5-dehydrogenase